jgi:hypothetical protein
MLLMVHAAGRSHRYTVLALLNNAMHSCIDRRPFDQRYSTLQTTQQQIKASAMLHSIYLSIHSLLAALPRALAALRQVPPPSPSPTA